MGIKRSKTHQLLKMLLSIQGPSTVVDNAASAGVTTAGILGISVDLLGSYSHLLKFFSLLTQDILKIYKRRIEFTFKTSHLETKIQPSFSPLVVFGEGEVGL